VRKKAEKEGENEREREGQKGKGMKESKKVTDFAIVQKP
jgi:hypothetical protein